MSPEHAELAVKLGAISKEELAAVGDLKIDVRLFPKNADVFVEGQRSESCHFILDGFAHRYRMLSMGQRQILSFHIPGDIPDTGGLYGGPASHGLGTLMPTRLALIPADALAGLAGNFPRIARSMWLDAMTDAAVGREWLVGVGRRHAHQRMAHLICELHSRMDQQGLLRSGRFAFPVTQADMADSLGLSAVHVNRVLGDLRRDGLITFVGKKMQILSLDRLIRAADFKATYLHPQNLA